MALRFGTVMHDVLERWYEGEANFIQPLFDWQREMETLLQGGEEVGFTLEDIDKAVELIESIMVRYEQKYREVDFSKWKVLGTEVDFRVPFRSAPTDRFPKGRKANWDLVGRVDLPVLDPLTNTLLIVDHKTTSIASPWEAQAAHATSQQTWAYFWAATQAPEQFGLKPDELDGIGIVYNYIRKKLPSEPKILKNGQLSKSSIDTLPEIFRAAMLKTGCTGEAWQDILNRLEARGDRFLHRHEVHLQRYIIEEWQRDAAATVSSIRQCRRTGVWPRNVQRCNVAGMQCEFAPICVDPFGGVDDEYRIEMLFDRDEGEGPVELAAKSDSE